MKHLFHVTLFLLLSFTSLFGYFSRFLNLSTNTMEYRMLQDPDSFSLYEAALLASGVDEDHLPEYLTQFSNIIQTMNTEIQASSPLDKAQKIFDFMHHRILQNYVESATTLDVVLKTGNFNCLSSTLLYNSLLEVNGYTARTVILPTHAFTQIIIGTNRIDVENTTPFGFNVSEDTQAQATLKKLTGFSYSSADTKREIVGKRGLIAYTYANRAFFAQRANFPLLSFQNALKSFAVKPDGGQMMTNVLAASVSYPAFLIDEKHDYIQALEILEEALTNLGKDTDLINNYKAALDREINRLVNLSDYSKSEQLYKHAVNLLGKPLSDIRKNMTIRTLYRLIQTDKDFVQAYNKLTNVRAELGQSPDIDQITLNGFYEIQKQVLSHWNVYPVGRNKLIAWYRLDPNNKDFQSVLDNYFSTVGINFYEKKNKSDFGISVMKYGLSIHPNSLLLKNNLSYIAGNTGISFLKKQDYPKALDYLQTALRYTDQKGSMESNIKVAYREWAYTELNAKHWKPALKIIQTGLKIFPTDSKLRQYERYVKRKIKN